MREGLPDSSDLSREPAIQPEQYQGVFRQFDVDFLLSVHFLWKRFLHLHQESSWSFGFEAAGSIERLQEQQENVLDCWMFELIALIVEVCSEEWAAASGWRRLTASQTGEMSPVLITWEPCTCNVLEVW